MPATKHNITIERNATFQKKLTWRTKAKRPVDLTGFSALLQVRDKLGNLLIEASTGNGRITITGLQGVIQIEISTVALAALQATNDAVYDLLLTAPDAKVYRLIEGKATIVTGVSVP